MHCFKCKNSSKLCKACGWCTQYFCENCIQSHLKLFDCLEKIQPEENPRLCFCGHYANKPSRMFFSFGLQDIERLPFECQSCGQTICEGCHLIKIGTRTSLKCRTNLGWLIFPKNLYFQLENGNTNKNYTIDVA